MKPSSFASLLATPQPADLGPGPRTGVETLATLKAKVDAALATSDIAGSRAELIRATVFLWHDHLEAAHELAQAVENRDGSYVHAIMHRREPDYSNAKYWFRRVGQHACFSELAVRAGDLLQAAGPIKLPAPLISRGQWDAFALVDACEMEADAREEKRCRLLRQVQALEFELLLRHLVGS
jgi:hypothetical protein